MSNTSRRDAFKLMLAGASIPALPAVAAATAATAARGWRFPASTTMCPVAS